MTRLREHAIFKGVGYAIGMILDAVSFGDLVFVIGVVLIFHGLKLVYGLGWACIGAGAILATTLYMGDLFAMTATLFLRKGQGNKSGRGAG